MKGKGKKMVEEDYKIAFSEVIYILNNMQEELVKKVPNKFITFMENNKSHDYVVNLSMDIPLKDMNLQPKTKTILAIIYINYLCNEQEKEEINKIINRNEQEYQEAVKEKYNPDNLFKPINNQDAKTEKKEKQLVIVGEEKWYKKILKKILAWFKR